MPASRYQALVQEKADLAREIGEFTDAAAARLDELPENPTEEQVASARLSEDERGQIETRSNRLEAIAEVLTLETETREHRRAGTTGSPGASTTPAPAFDENTRDQDNPRAMFGFYNLADFALSVREASRDANAVVDPRLTEGPQAYIEQMQAMGAPTNFHQEAGASEGFMVPPALRNEIWELVFNGTEILGLLDIEPTGSNAVDLLKDETTPWGSSGVSANWRAEGNQMSASKLDTDAEQVRLNDLYAFVLATNELLADAPRLNSRLTRRAPEAIRWKASDAIVNGSGAGQPLGWMNSGALVPVPKEAGQTADTVVAANVANSYARVLNPGEAICLTNQDVFPQLALMTLGDQPIWTPPRDGFAAAPGGFLFGRPVQFNEHAQTLGDEGDFQWVNPKGYYATQHQDGIAFATSIHLYFDYNIQAFRWTFRLGGQPFLSAPVTPANGPNTRSHFVTVAERA